MRRSALASVGDWAMGDSEAKLTDLQFTILDGMADDYEDLEQLYLYANREFAEESQATVEFPRMVIQVRSPLREIVDEIANMLDEGLIHARYSNDEKLAPLQPLDFTLLHHYWFGPTDKGTKAWKANRSDKTGQ